MGTRWFIQDDDLLVQHRDDRGPDGVMPVDGVFGFFSLAMRKGRWERNDNAIDVYGFGGVSGAREITEAEARKIEAAWLTPGAEPAP